MIFDIAIIGGGVIGAACFSKLTRLGQKVVLIEKETDVAMGASKANSGLVHAGFDCKPNTLKAKFNVLGNSMIPVLCDELSVPYKKTGALVASNDLEKIKELFERGKQNGVKELSIIDDEKLHKLVPNLSPDIHYALFAKTAGIVSPYMLTIALAEEAVINGGETKFRFKIEKIKKNTEFFTIFGQNETVFAKKIINASGAGFNEISKLLKTETYPLEFRRGEYFMLDKNLDFVNLTVFPLPSASSKGVLATPTASGNTMFGPTSDASNYDTSTTAEGLGIIKSNINQMFTNVPWHKAIREFAGVRVLSGNDFIVEKSKLNPNVINLCGICSPGLSSAPAIAEYVARNLLEIKTNEKFKRRKPYTKTKNMTADQLNALISKHKAYGNIVCRCETVTEGEILEAIHSPLKPTTIDAIKRRVRAGMGRCQGGFCSLKVANLISRETGIPLEKIEKDAAGSFIIKGNIKENL